MPSSTPAARLRACIAEPGALVVPCVHDAFTARLAEQAGFPVVDVESAGSLAMAFGLSDHGIGNVSDLLGHARDVAMAVSVPAFADLDDGGGSPLAIGRTVAVASRVGIAGIHLDDVQSGCKGFPGHPDVILDDDRALARVRAAIDARGDGDLVLVARTYAADPEQAWSRLEAFAALGADVLFPVRHGYDALLERAGRLPRPLYCVDRRNVAPPAELAAAGVKFVMDNDVFQISAKLVRDLLIELRREGCIADAAGRSLSWEEFHRVMGTPEAERLALAYGLITRSRP